MSKFYGQVRGCAKTTVSRRGSSNSGLTVSAQSWDGSVIIRMFEGDNNTTLVSIDIADESSMIGSQYFSGTIDELKNVLEGKPKKNRKKEK